MGNKPLKKVATDKRKAKVIVGIKGESSKRKYIVLLLVLALTVLVYSNSIRNGFVSYDDDKYIAGNEYIKGVSASNVGAMFTDFYFSNYHPLTTLSYAIDYHFAFDKVSGKIDAGRFHLVNLLFHLLNVLLVFQLIYLLIRKMNLSAIGALLFAIHPMHVESVSWISERKDVLYAFFFLLSVIAYIYYQRNEGKYKYLVYSFVCFCLSLLSKSMAVTLPVLLLLLDYYKKRKIGLRNVLEKIPFFALSLVFGIIAIKSQQAGGAISDLTPSFSMFDRVFMVSYGLLFYVFKFFAPFNLSVLHSYPELIGGGLPIWYYFSMVAMIGVLGLLIFKSFKFKREIVFGLLFFLVTVSVVLQVFPVGQAIVAERYSYIPYIGLIFIVIQLYIFIKEKNVLFFNSIKPYVIGVLTIYIMVFSYLTWNRNKVWKDSLSLWTDVVEKNARDYYGHYGVGNALYVKGEFDEALKHYNASIDIRPTFALSYYNRGIAKFAQTNYKGAIEDYTKAIEIDAKYQEAYSNRGSAKLQLQDYKGAMQDYDKAIEINPKDASEYYNRGNVAYYMQKDSLALRDFNKAIDLKPIYPDAYINRGLLYYYMKNLNGACNDWNEALNMGHQEALNYLNQFCK